MDSGLSAYRVKKGGVKKGGVKKGGVKKGGVKKTKGI
ncbi:hypothetical protein N406_07500 [Helicobacter pylori FD577]|nr:hypothetical protein N406_07500 [Helicobacter pylori FD577]